MLLDADVLLYPVNEDSRFHHQARDWVTSAPQRIAVPWLSLWAFVRIVTNPRALPEPLLPHEAWEHGVEVVSADSDFARFTEITWVNPVAA